MTQCLRAHSAPVEQAVEQMPTHDSHRLQVPRCAQCAYEEGVVKGVELAANMAIQALASMANQLRQQHDAVEAAEQIAGKGESAYA